MCQPYYQRIIYDDNVFFPFLLFLHSFFKLREREYIIGYREKQSYNLLIFSDGFLWRIFSLLRAEVLSVIFSSGLKVWLLFLVQDSFRFLYPESWHEIRVLSRRPHLQKLFFTRSLAWDPFTKTSVQKLIFFFPISVDGTKVPLPF